MHRLQAMAAGGHEESNKKKVHVCLESVLELKDVIVRFKLTNTITIIYNNTFVNLNIQIVLNIAEDTSR